MKGSRAEATVFLCGGRITSALVAGLRLSGYGQPIIVHDRHAQKLRKLKRQYGVVIEHDLRRAVDQAHLLIIAVRPDGIGQLLDTIKYIKRPITAISLAAGVPLAKLRARLVTFEPAVSPGVRRDVKQLFERVGQVIEIPERKFDAFTVTYSSSHGYHALAALAGAAQRAGLDRQTAMTAAAHALADGILVWRESKMALDELLREAATPGGTAATVMAAMSSAGYERAVAKGLRAGMARARKNTGLG